MRKIFQKLYRKSFQELMDVIEKSLKQEKRMMIVTANPEVITRSQELPNLYDVLLDDETLITPDGEGVVKAAEMLGYPVQEKLAGVQMVEEMMRLGNQLHKSVYIYGSAQTVLDQLKKKMEQNYPNLTIVGMKNGYDHTSLDVFQDMMCEQPDMIFVALGVPRQEMEIAKYIKQFDKGIFVGVGGSLDVLSGTKKRAPKVLIKWKLEWLYRLCKEPKRIKKFYHTHVKFMMKMKKMAKENAE